VLAAIPYQVRINHKAEHNNNPAIRFPSVWSNSAMAKKTHLIISHLAKMPVVREDIDQDPKLRLAP